MPYVGALACFALIRRFAPPSPPGGRLLRQFVIGRYSADLQAGLRSRTEKICAAEGGLPPGGEGGAPAPDEGGTASAPTYGTPVSTQVRDRCRRSGLPVFSESPGFRNSAFLRHPCLSVNDTKNSTLTPGKFSLVCFFTKKRAEVCQNS